MQTTPQEKTGTLYKSEAFEDIRRALVGDGDLETNPEGYPVDGELGARVTCERISARKEGTGDDALRYVCGGAAGEGAGSSEELLDDFCARMRREDRTTLGLSEAGEGSTELTDASPAPRVSEQPVTATVPAFEDRAACEPRAARFDPLRAGMASYSSLAGGHVGASDPDDAPTGKSDALDVAEDVDADSAGTLLSEAEALADEGVLLGESDASAGEASAMVVPGSDAWAVPTSFGSAFHLAAQWMAACHDAGALDSATGLPLMPSDERLHACLAAFDMPDPTPGQLARLRDAIRRWAGSRVAREAYAYPRTQGEAPLCVGVGQADGEVPTAGEGRGYLEGSIDLLCFDPARPYGAQRALVVDYKTGGADDEGPLALHEKHLLQAQCYALAVLDAGFAGVDLRFARIERRDATLPGNEPQVASYAFGRDDLPVLRSTIIARFREKGVLPEAWHLLGCDRADADAGISPNCASAAGATSRHS